MTSRREFIEGSALAALGLSLKGATAGDADSSTALGMTPSALGMTEPDSVWVQLSDRDITLAKGSNGEWARDGVVVTTRGNRISLSAPSVSVKRIQLRWRRDMSSVRLSQGDAWERGYGDLEWRSWVPDRVMPWYFATFDGTRTNTYGVRTGPRAFCFWTVDPKGITLWADVRSGGVGVQLGERVLDVCDVVSRDGRAGESSFAAIHAFCKQMCSAPRMPAMPVYGSNDWYWAYGKNSAESVRTDAKHIVELSPAGSNRPVAVIDDGWQPVRGTAKVGVGKWDAGNEKFGDMARLAADVREIGARPGIWVRPLQATTDTPDSLRLPRDKQFVDPTLPDVLQKVRDDMARLRGWGYELIKHDYTTYDIFGRWGFQMGSAMTRDGWMFAEGPKRTTAEVITDLYATIRAGAGDALVIGCNTVSHLSAGHFEICRVGDDTSGTEWNRTRKMGVNTLAFRGVQHGAFYVADADCVGVTNAVPWELNRQWLDLLARSGTMLFVSLDPAALGVEQRRDLKAALALAAVPQKLAEPMDWQRNVYPSRWRMMGREFVYEWMGNGVGNPP